MTMNSEQEHELLKSVLKAIDRYVKENDRHACASRLIEVFEDADMHSALLEPKRLPWPDFEDVLAKRGSDRGL
jgi:hypothetical protein